MGHLTVLVIGDNFRDQLDRYQRHEYAAPSNRHIVTVDVLNEARERYDAGNQAQKGSFLDWAKLYYGSKLVNDGQEPDRGDVHREGWIRLNSDGQVCEMMQRTIPGGFFDWFEFTEEAWLLKPGAEGFVVPEGGDQEAVSVTDGYAGSARKRDIDFDAMTAKRHQLYADRWDWAAATHGSNSWQPFPVILQKYAQEKVSDEVHLAAVREWAAQPAVDAIIAASRLNKPPHTMREYQIVPNTTMNTLVLNAIDPYRLPRNQYITESSLRHVLPNDVIMHGKHLKGIDTAELFASIPDEAWMTCANVHA